MHGLVLHCAAEELDGVACGAVHELQVRSIGASGVGGERGFTWYVDRKINVTLI